MNMILKSICIWDLSTDLTTNTEQMSRNSASFSVSFLQTMTDQCTQVQIYLVFHTRSRQQMWVWQGVTRRSEQLRKNRLISLRLFSNLRPKHWSVVWYVTKITWDIANKRLYFFIGSTFQHWWKERRYESLKHLSQEIQLHSQSLQMKKK